MPSQHEATTAYEVVLGYQESCECADHGYRHGICVHIIAATIARAKTAPCSGCGERYRHRELYEVGEDNLSHFEGDKLCKGCAADHGVL